MKIKHFMGYGSVTATKVRKTDFINVFGEQMSKMIVRVKGEHECGLERNDTYDAFNWLLKRFDKSVESYTQIVSFETKDYYMGNEEVCDYIFVYRK